MVGCGSWGRTACRNESQSSSFLRTERLGRKSLDYLYSHPELQALANTIRSVQAQDVTVQFNNNNRDYPVDDAVD